jgi:hypothetical protein
MLGHWPAHDLPGIQVDDNGQVQPTLLGTELSDIANINLINLLYGKIPIQQIIRNR